MEPTIDAAIEAAIKLHPQGTTGWTPGADDTKPRPRYTITKDQVKRFINKQASFGTAGGPSGWDFALLAVTIKDAEVLTNLTLLFQLILDGDAPAALDPYLLAGSLVPLQDDTGKIRPINMGEVFYRTPAGILASSHAPTVAQILDNQLGVGVSGGTEKLLHWATAMLTDPTTPRFGLQLDWKAAFQSIERSKMFEALGKKPKLDQLYRFVRWSYSEGSPIFMRGPDGLFLHPDIASLRGVRQGDPL